MTKILLHLTDGEVVSLDDVAVIHTIYKKTSTDYAGDDIAKVPVRSSFAYLFESVTRKLSVSGEQIKYVEFTSQ